MGRLMQPRPDHIWLRACLGVVGLLALAWGAGWAYEIMRVFAPDFNPASAPSSHELRPLTILGCLGVLASLLAGGFAFAYAKTAEGVWAAGATLAVGCGVPLFVVWIDVWELAGGCS